MVKLQRKKQINQFQNGGFFEMVKRAILGSPQVRALNHVNQTLNNQTKRVIKNLKKGNYKKAILSAEGIPVDIVSSIPTNIFGYNMYTAPIKDIINSQYNRASRNITGDPTFVAIKGQEYGENDMSKGMWDKAIEMQKKVENGENSRTVADKMAKEVNSNYSYSSPQLLFHPFNHTAHYLWTIGGQGKANGDSYVDLYDNNKSKTQSYLRSFEQGWRDGSSISKQIGRSLRGFGGLLTSQDEDPDEQKQAVVIPSQK